MATATAASTGSGSTAAWTSPHSVLLRMTVATSSCTATAAFSLREGASPPQELVRRPRRLGYPALALTDHDSLAGAMQFAQAAQG